MVRLEAPYYALFSVLLASDQRAWGASVILHSHPTCPQDRGIFLQGLPSTDSSFRPQQPRGPPLSPGFTVAQWFGSSQIP